jgi:hypothetical protein
MSAKQLQRRIFLRNSLWGAAATVAGGAATVARATGTQTAYGHSFEPVKESTMIKFTCLAARRSDLTAEAFHKRWLFEHAELVVKYRTATRAHRYVQSHVIDSPAINAFSKGRNWTPNPYDGLVELWWASEEEMVAGLGSPDGQKASTALAEDERAFCDSRTIVFMTREYEIFTTPGFHL